MKRASVSGKCWPMSPSAGGAEQRVDHRVREDVGVGVAGQALLVRDVDAAEDQRPAGGERVRVDAEAGADHQPIGSIRRSPPLEHAQLGHAGVGERGERVVVAEAELLGHVRVGGERDRQAGVDRHLQQRRRRVELADGLAQPRRRDLHRDAGVEHRLDGGLVVVARVALGQRPRAAPDLDEVGVGHDVVEAGAGGLARASRSSAPRPCRAGRRGPRRGPTRGPRGRRRRRRRSGPSRRRSPTRAPRGSARSGPRGRST